MICDVQHAILLQSLQYYVLRLLCLAYQQTSFIGFMSSRIACSRLSLSASSICIWLQELIWCRRWVSKMFGYVDCRSLRLETDQGIWNSPRYKIIVDASYIYLLYHERIRMLHILDQLPYETSPVSIHLVSLNLEYFGGYWQKKRRHHVAASCFSTEIFTSCNKGRASHTNLGRLDLSINTAWMRRWILMRNNLPETLRDPLSLLSLVLKEEERLKPSSWWKYARAWLRMVYHCVWWGRCSR